jgi:hypothetical protein
VWRYPWYGTNKQLAGGWSKAHWPNTVPSSAQIVLDFRDVCLAKEGRRHGDGHDDADHHPPAEVLEGMRAVRRQAGSQPTNVEDPRGLLHAHLAPWQPGPTRMQLPRGPTRAERDAGTKT